MHQSLVYVAVFFLSPVASHSQSFVFYSFACFTVFSLSSVVFDSQSWLSYMILNGKGHLPVGIDGYSLVSIHF